MKKIFLLMAGIAVFSAVNAQVKYGVKAGLNLANVAGDIDNTKMKAGLSVGAFAKVGLTESLSLQPELVFSAQGSKMKYSEDGISYDVKTNLSYVNVPVLLQYNTASGFFAETGPQFGFLLSAKAKAEGVKEDVKDSFKSLDLGWAFGAGFLTTSNVGVNARFNLGLGNIADRTDGEDFKVRNSVIQIGVFYVLGSK
jgi:hypothetical protein